MEKHKFNPVMKIIEEDAELQKLFNKMENDMLMLLKATFNNTFRTNNYNTKALPVIELQFQRHFEKTKLRCQLAYAEFH
ncbi:hypothetical protein [uncultured Kriegella sp.]|uniref:hypothetical protein n=1 Tax=uncultured Kriegella sp. TaxID=1798910 RepID=UPI0030DA3B40|tara:strand:+ start:44043 stop:44279 length:237 start_codon:yes stop_codon:yes gene_type:complete